MTVACNLQVTESGLQVQSILKLTIMKDNPYKVKIVHNDEKKNVESIQNKMIGCILLGCVPHLILIIGDTMNVLCCRNYLKELFLLGLLMSAGSMSFYIYYFLKLNKSR